jgi:hypothetical protein
VGLRLRAGADNAQLEEARAVDRQRLNARARDDRRSALRPGDEHAVFANVVRRADGEALLLRDDDLNVAAEEKDHPILRVTFLDHHISFVVAGKRGKSGRLGAQGEDGAAERRVRAVLRRAGNARGKHGESQTTHVT